jgi:tight adherence protein C
MPLSLILLTALLTVAVTAAAYAYYANRARREVLSRAGGQPAAAVSHVLIVEPQVGLGARLADWIRRHTPASWSDPGSAADKLIQAGFQGPSAGAAYASIRLASAIGLPLLAIVFAPRASIIKFLMFLIGAIALGLLAPPGVLDRIVQMRQAKIRRALPDALDLLVVCVEAGISLDAAILRVAREMDILHPDLAAELLVVNRKVNAGVTRESALHGLWTRTGVEELRGLGASMIQCEKWGTSISKVLRVYAETLRRKRKQAAEKKAAEASLKMLFPLVLFIFPTIFIAILGPAGMSMSRLLK